MRWLTGLCLLILYALPVHGQAVVSGNLKTIGVTNAAAPGTLVRFTLQGFGSNIPRITGTGILAQSQYEFRPDASGVITGSVYTNDTITPAGTFYSVCIFDQGRQFRCANYNVTGSSFNLNNAVPLNVYPAAATSATIGTQSVTCSFAALTTWTCTHNMGVTEIVADFYDSNSQRILPDTVVKTSTNVLTATFTVAQAGTMTVIKAGNFTFTAGNLTLADVFVKTPAADQVSIGNYRIASAGSLGWKSGTSFFGTFAHANTADRTYTFPNATGTVPLLSFANTWTSPQAFADALTPTINGTNLGVPGVPGLRWNLYAVYGNFSNDVTPATNATVDLGTSSFRWKSIYGNDSITIGTPSILSLDYNVSTGLFNVSAANVAYSAKIKVDAGPGSGGCIWLRSNVSPSNDCGGTGAITMGNNRYFYGRALAGGAPNMALIGTNTGDDVVVGGEGNDTGFVTTGSGKTVIGGLTVSIVGALKLVVATLTNNSTTPSVVALIVTQASNTSPTTITDFTGGLTGQIIYVLFTNGNTTIQDGAGLQLAGGANFVGTADDMLVLLRVGSVWYELSRSVN